MINFIYDVIFLLGLLSAVYLLIEKIRNFENRNLKDKFNKDDSHED